MVSRKWLLGLAGLVAMGLVQVVRADYRLSVGGLVSLYGVQVTNAIVNGVSRDICSTLYDVPEGAEVVLALGDDTGFIWGTNNLVRIDSVNSDMKVNTLPEEIRAYKGTVDSPVLIYDYDDLGELRRRVNNGRSMSGIYFKQVRDIDFRDRPAWEAIGITSAGFGGIYDGGGHRLDNLCLAHATKSSFINTLANGGAVSNVTVSITGVDDTSGTGIGAGFIGAATQDSTLRHLVVEGTISGVSSDSAGVVICANRSQVIGCTNRVNVSGCSSALGGVAAVSSYKAGTKSIGTDFIDCANEGNVTATKVGSRIGGSVGLGGIVASITGNQSTKLIRCVSRGILTPATQKSRVGSIIGCDYCGEAKVATEGCEASAGMSPVGIIKKNSYTLTGLNFATVASGWASFCDTPTAVGDYQVMLTNGESIVLSNVKVGDRLTLANYNIFTGTVACADSALTVTGENGVWTVGAGMSADVGTLEAGSADGVYVLVPAAEQTSATVSGFSGTVLQVPSSITSIKGVDRSQLQIMSGGYDITSALAFVGNATDGYTLSLDGSATVGGVKVTPTIGENVDEPFSVGDDVRLAVQSIPGLWYALWRGENPAAITNLCAKTMATGGTVTLEDAPDAGNGYFYKVGVTVR